VTVPARKSSAAVRESWRVAIRIEQGRCLDLLTRLETRLPASTRARRRVAYRAEKGCWPIPQKPPPQRHGQRRVVAGCGRGQIPLSRGVKARRRSSIARSGESWIQDHLSVGEIEGDYYIKSEYSFHAGIAGAQGCCWWATPCFLDPGVQQRDDARVEGAGRWAAERGSRGAENRRFLARACRLRDDVA